MSATDEVKARLKSAKEWIQQKNYKQALKECQAALKLDPKNYTSLVFSGLCHCELNDALEARKMYETATQLEPKQILAWQGFVQFYEKFSIFDDSYRRCLDSLRDLTTDPVKKLDVSSKLAKLYAKMNKIEDALKECSTLIRLSDDDKKIEYECLVIECVGNFTLTNAELIDMVTNCYKNRTFDQSESSKRNEIGSKFCQFLIRHNARQKALEIAKSLLEKGSPNVEILSIISHELVSRFVGGSFNATEDLSTLNSVLDYYQQDSEEDSSVDVMSLFLESISEQLNNKFSEALDILEDIDPSDIETSQEYFALVSLVQLKLNNHAEALKFAEKCLLDKISGTEFKRRMSFVKAESLFWLNETDSKKIPEILSLYEYVIKECTESDSPLLKLCSLGVARCKFLIDGDTTAMKQVEKELSSDVDACVTVAWYHWKLKEFDVAARFVRHAVDEEPENNFPRLLLGKILWASGERTNETMKHFVESAKLNSNSWESFYYLALCQMDINKNDERALACLERANLLTDNRNEIVGLTLAELYRKLKLDEKYLKFLTSVTESVGADAGFWAWFRLGVELASKNRADEAVSTFQTLLRSHPTSIRCWECLADAYCARGSFASSMKTFEKVLELEPTSMYALYRIACIKSTLNYDDEAAAMFDEILKNFDPTYVPAMLGLAESLFRGSQLYFSQGRHFRALDLRRRCIIVLIDCWKFNETLCLSRDASLCTPWKLFGDVLTSLNDFDASTLTNFAEVLNEIFPTNTATVDTVDDTSSEKLYLLRCGAQCYMRAIHLRSNLADLWHDLTLNFFLQTKIDPSNFAKTFESAKQTVRLNPIVSKYWSTLGCVATSIDSSSTLVSPAFVQHCFVKSLKLDALNSCAWTNLGVFYFTQNDVALAHECFKRAQSVDPNYVQAWVGQALIAEKMAPHEAMDLFRHCSELGNNLEGLSGYAYHVLAMMLDAQVDRKSADYTYAIEHLYAVPMARDGLIKYISLRPDDVCVLNLLGCLSELESMFESALNYYQNALSIAEASNHGFDVINSLYSNLCRISGKLKNRTVFETFSKRLKKTSFVDQCSIALSLYRLNLYTECFAAYQESLKLVKSVDDEMNVKLAQCITLLNQAGGDETSKFFNNECKKVQSSVWLLTAIVLSMKKVKIDTKTILNGFEKIWSDGYFDLQTLLVSLIAIVKQETNIKLASWIVHKCPHIIPSWFIMQRSCVDDQSLRNKFQKRSLEIKSNNKTVRVRPLVNSS